MKEKKPLTIWGKGNITRDYIYIKDIVPVMIKSLEAKHQGRIFNLGSGQGTTLLELIEIIKGVTGQEVRVEHKEERAIDVPVNVLDISRAKEEFGFSPTTSLREGIKRTWKWINRA